MEDVRKSNAFASVDLSIRHIRARSLKHNLKKLDNHIYAVNEGENDRYNECRSDILNGVIGGKHYSASFASGGTWVQIEKVDNDFVTEQVGGGDRGNVYGFSYASRMRLLRAMAKLDRSGISINNVIFVTLTYSELTEQNKGISGKEYKRHLKNITDSIYRKYGGFGVWRWELQKRMVGHFHMIWYGVRYIDMDWIRKRWNEITQGTEKHFASGTRVERARSWLGTSLYGSKVMGYVAKDESTVAQRKHMKDIHIGRVWGIVNRSEYKENIALVDADLEEEVYQEMVRTYRRLQKSWKFKKGDYKGWQKQKHWFDSWNRLRTCKLQFFMENNVFIKLLDYAYKKVKSKVKDIVSGKWNAIGLIGVTDGVMDGHSDSFKSGFGSWSSKVTECYS